MDDKVLELGYDVTVASLAAEREFLGKLRDRGISLVSVSAIATSLAAGARLVRQSPPSDAGLQTWLIVLLLVPALLIAANALYALLPITVLSLDPSAFLAAHEHGLSQAQAQRSMIEAAVLAMTQNKRELNRRLVSLQVAVGLLVTQLALLTLAVSLH